MENGCGLSASVWERKILRRKGQGGGTGRGIMQMDVDQIHPNENDGFH
jgi:hypothetical protein